MKKQMSQPPPLEVKAHNARPMSDVLEEGNEEMFSPKEGSNMFLTPPVPLEITDRSEENTFDNLAVDIVPSTSEPDTSNLEVPQHQSKYQKNPKRKEPSENVLKPSDPAFEISDDKKVATIIQRLTKRLRNKLSSVRYNEESSSRPELDTITQPPEEVPSAQPYTKNKEKVHIDIKPQLHRLPRGYAPASRVVP